jgi:aryl-phospho-beta-D-glucosidase BglC (GH1 family)
MNLEQIKQSLSEGKKVFWSNENYEVIKDKINKYLIHCVVNDHCIGLTHKDGKTLNGEENEFFTK